MNNTGKTPWLPILMVIIVAGVLIGGLIMILPQGQQLAIVPGTPTPSTTPSGTIKCSGSPSPEMVLNVFESINKNTKVSDVNAIVFKQSGSNWIEDTTYNLASDNSIDASPGDKLKIILTPSVGGNPGIQFTGKTIYAGVGCEERQDIVENNDKVLVDQQGTATFTIFNSDDGLANAAGDQSTIGTGETVSMSFKWKEGTADKCIGSSAGTLDLVQCTDYNSSCIQSVEVQGGALVDTPQGEATERSTRYDSTKCYALTGVKKICDFAETADTKAFKLVIGAKAAVNPLGSDSCDMNVRLTSGTMYLNTETGTWNEAYRNGYDGNRLMQIYTGHVYIN